LLLEGVLVVQVLAVVAVLGALEQALGFLLLRVLLIPLRLALVVPQ
jgi:hypothetical protein